MQLGAWYIQKFSDMHLYFLPVHEQKNGGFKGVLVKRQSRKPSLCPNTGQSETKSID